MRDPGHRRGRPPTPAIPARQLPDPCNKLTWMSGLQKSTACDADHRSSRRWQGNEAARPFDCGRGVRAMEGAMLKVGVWNKSVPRVELDQRARDARLQLERMEQ